jgi:hypothetical protein
MHTMPTDRLMRFCISQGSEDDRRGEASKMNLRGVLLLPTRTALTWPLRYREIALRGYLEDVAVHYRSNSVFKAHLSNLFSQRCTGKGVSLRRHLCTTEQQH